MSEPSVRASTDRDIDAIAEIYGHHVLHGTASFETVAPEPNAIADRRQAVLDHGLPYLVAEIDGRIAGFAYAGTYRPRPAYRFTVENSVYIRPGLERRGLGRLLMMDVLRHCEDGPWRQMIAVIGDSANQPSIRLHEALGFQHVGVLRSAGFKFGRWLDAIVMQRALSDGDASAPDSFYRA
jgi:L-amino acid N-acyltransferase YncA